MIKEGVRLRKLDKLIYAIVKCAIDDYKAELRHIVRFQVKGQYINGSIEPFFKSEYFDFMVSQTGLKGIKGEEVIEAIKEKETKRKGKRRRR